jgi:hypothetical protein
MRAPVCSLHNHFDRGAGTNPSTHDVGGFANSGVYPDGTANEEWWGIVTVDRKTRKAYDALRALYMAP